MHQLRPMEVVHSVPTEMQVEESMVHFPSPLSMESPSAFSPASFSDCTTMSIDQIVNPSSTLHVTSESFTAAEKAAFHSGDGYESQLYTVMSQPPPSAYPSFDLDELENLFGVHADVERGGFGATTLESLEEELPVKRPACSAKPAVHAHPSNVNAMSPGQQRPNRLQHSLSMRIVSSQRPARASRPPSTRNQRDLIRVSKPVFPTESVPLQEVSRRERPPSATPSLSSTRSDPFDTISSRRSVGAISDPGAYSVKSMQSGDSGTGSICSAPGGLQSSTGNFSESFAGDFDFAPRHCMEVEMHIRHVRKIIELDKKILKLQAERSRLVEKAQQSTARADSPSEEKRSLMDKPGEIGRVHLFFVPIGIHPIDEPIFEEANSLLRTIGGMYFDLERAIATLRNICCKGMLVVPDFSTCFAYMKSLLQETQRLQLSNSRGTYQIHVDLGAGNSQPVPQEFTDALAMANRVLQAAQTITQSYHHIQMQLQRVQGMARDQTQLCDSICQSIGLMDRDRRGQIKAVMDGNYATVTTAVRVWPHYYEAATETIKAITDCIHPPIM